MLCWVCERLCADRGGVCHICRSAAIGASSAYTPHRRAGKLIAVLAGVISLTAGLVSPTVSTPTAPGRAHSNFESLQLTPVAYKTAMVLEEVKRKVYPYSIVPGGAQNLREAKQAMSDPAVKANYAGINLTQLKQVKLATNLSGYVSYRWGDKIYWTKKMLTLRAGETVFTDGQHIVRGRCLNCYSAFPMLPTRPIEPAEKVLDTPVELPETVYSFPKLPVTAPELPMPPGELTPVAPPIAPTVVPTGGKPGRGIWFPLIPIIPPIHHHPSQPGSPTSPSGPGVPLVPPVTVIPEPHYSWVLAIGIFAMVLAYRARRRKSA